MEWGVMRWGGIVAGDGFSAAAGRIETPVGVGVGVAWGLVVLISVFVVGCDDKCLIDWVKMVVLVGTWMRWRGFKPKRFKLNLQRYRFNFQRFKFKPKCFKFEPQRFKFEPKRFKFNFQRFRFKPKCFKFNLQRFKFNLRRFHYFLPVFGTIFIILVNDAKDKRKIFSLFKKLFVIFVFFVVKNGIFMNLRMENFLRGYFSHRGTETQGK